MKQVPYNDLSRIHDPLCAEFEIIFKKTLTSNIFIGGPSVTSFEKKFEKVFGLKNVVGCANGTDAILGCLKALNLRAGDEVIVPSMTWISSAEVVNLAGGKPIFCDVDKETFVAEAENIAPKISKKTKGIILVHLYGNMPDMEKIIQLAKMHKLWIIEDCAQAHLSSYKGKPAGTFGDFGTFSFFPGKNLGAFGDAGAVCAKNKEHSKHLRAFFNHGAVEKHNHYMIGTNSRLDTLQAQILEKKLDYIKKWTSERIAIAEMYDRAFENNKNIKIQKTGLEVVNSRHIYPVLVLDRTKYLDALKKEDVGFNINYPKPLHKQSVYCDDEKIFSLRNSEMVADCQISLPIFPKMTINEVRRVIEVINSL